MPIDVNLVKSWARIDGEQFDAVLPMMIASAVALASHETGVDYTQVDMPPNVQQWCAAQVSYWINNPDAGAEGKTNPSPFLGGLLDPDRTFGGEPSP